MPLTWDTETFLNDVATEKLVGIILQDGTEVYLVDEGITLDGSRLLLTYESIVSMLREAEDEIGLTA